MGGGNELSLRFIIFLLHGLSCVFTVMSAVNLDELGFTAPAGSAPPSSDSSVDHPPDSRSKCVARPWRMSANMADRHTLCVVCKGFDCTVETRCEECIEWPEEEVRLYAKMRKSLKSKGSSKRRDKPPAASPPPQAASVPSPQPHALINMQSQVVSLSTLVNSLSESLFARMDALQASLASSVPPASSRPFHRPDASSPQPGVTAGESHMFQALGESCRRSGANDSLGQGARTPRPEYAGPSAASQPQAGPSSAHSASFVPPPPRSEVPPQPSTSGWVPSGPPRSRGSRSSSESEASDAEFNSSARDSAFTRLADLIYDACPNSRPLLDDSRPPHCEFRGLVWPAARPLFWLYPRVAEVESEAKAEATSLSRRPKPLSSILTSRYGRHAVADLPLYASSLVVNPSFSQLAGAKAVGSKRWGSVSFAEMEKLERLFRQQLQLTSKSLAVVRNLGYVEA